MGEVTNQGLQNADFDMSQFYGIFFEEAGENLASFESLLLAIDVEDASDDELNAIFRVAHSIKGGASTFGFADVTEMTHELETLLDRVRKHELPLVREMVDVLIESSDALKAQLACHQGASGHCPDTSELVMRIKQLAAGETHTAREGWRRLRLRIGPLKEEAAAKRMFDNIAELFRDIPSLGQCEPVDGERFSAGGFCCFTVWTRSSDTELVELLSFHAGKDQIFVEPLTPPATSAAQAAAEHGAAALEGKGYGFFVDPATLPAAQAGTAPAGAPVAAKESRREARKADKSGGAHLETSTLRVSVEKVDQLINLVGELVITQAMMTQQAKQFDPVQHQSLLTAVNDLERNTRHLQESVMSIRMIPMSFVFNRFPRVIRDLCMRLGKEIELKMVGEATELDKGLIEKIIDPLTHLVRNAADHGIESPAKRMAAGKPAHGTITLSAAHQGGSIVIEVRDDGGGLSREKILAKARERDIPGLHEAMTDHEVYQIVWEPGFSTADQLTDVSGRGVGMDVVRRNITELGGTIELNSVPGAGTRIVVRLPLTLAIMDGMSIGVGKEIYILPLSSVVESFQIEEDSIKTVTGSERLVKVRDEYLPVVALDEVFSVPRFDEELAAQVIVIIENEGQRIAAIVDELLGQQQVVVKNLETNYRKVRGVSGATILGDGRVALIIDVAGLVKRARH